MMAGLLGTLRQNAVWSQAGDKVAVDPTVLSALASLVGSLAGGEKLPEPSQEEGPQTRKVKSQQNVKTYNLASPVRGGNEAATESSTVPIEVDAEDSESEMTDKSLAEAMKLTQMKLARKGVQAITNKQVNRRFKTK